MKNRIINSPGESKFQLPLLMLLLTALFLNLYNINFPTGYHIDETKKFRFVRTMDQDFRHPILMLQAARLFTAPLDPEKQYWPFVIMCRLVSVLSGVFIVYTFFQLSKKNLGHWPAFGAALGLAVSPIMVIHSHYLKEDMIFTFFSILTLFLLLKFYRDQKISCAVYLGIASGLALSSQYKGILLFILILVSPFFAGETDRRSFFAKIPIVLVTAVLVFFAVNYPIFINPENFMEGLSYETGHVLQGHTARISPLSHYFSFHLVHSIAPGIRWPFTVLGIMGFVLLLIKWKYIGTLEKLFAAYFLLFYFFHEVVPLKPFPGFPRYMIPIIPAMFFFTGFLLRTLISKFKTTVMGTVTVIALSLLIIFSSYDSFLLDYHLKRDTRAKAAALIKKSGGKAIFERHATDEKYDATWLAKIDLEKAKKKEVKFLVASSFNYGRFYLDEKKEGQSPFFYGLRRKYDHLFSLPFKEIKPVHRTYAYSNPVIRIIDINDN